MGLISFFKKLIGSQEELSRPDSFVCDFISGTFDYKDAVVKFDDTLPSKFLINDTAYEANFRNIRDIGLCKYNKYERIAAGEWVFYLQKGFGRYFMDKMIAARKHAVEKSIATTQEKEFLEYISEGFATYKTKIIFNPAGVTYDYGTNTQKTISKLFPGDRLILKLWPNAPDKDSKICVFTNDNQQIGYMELSDYDPIDAEFYKQMMFGVHFDAIIQETGIVRETNIRWCKASLDIRLPYPADSEIAYSNGFGGAYHCKKGCSGAEREIPMYWVEKYQMRPCKRCHKDLAK